MDMTPPPSRNAEAEAFVERHIATLNRAKPSAIAADFEEDCVIVDAFPPFLWRGPGAASRWWRDMETAIAPAGLDRVDFRLDEWQRAFVATDSCFASARATARIAGPAFAVEASGVLTLTLKRYGDGWKIASWGWGGPPARPRPV